MKMHKIHSETKSKINLMTKSLQEKCKRSPTIDFTDRIKEDIEGDKRRREESASDVPVGSWGSPWRDPLSFAPHLFRV